MVPLLNTRTGTSRTFGGGGAGGWVPGGWGAGGWVAGGWVTVPVPVPVDRGGGWVDWPLGWVVELPGGVEDGCEPPLLSLPPSISVITPTTRATNATPM